MEYVTISKFAEIAGVTPQAVYRRLKTDLAPYSKEENGIKLVNTDALELFTAKQLASKSSREEYLEKEVEKLTADIAAKQQIINDLTSQLAAFNEKSLEIMDRQSTQFQQLLAIQQTSYQQLINVLNPPKEVENDKQDFSTRETTVNKRGLLKRLFSSRHD